MFSDLPVQAPGPTSLTGLEAPRGCTDGWEARTDGQPDLLLLVGQAVVVEQVEEPLGPPVPQELRLQAEEHAEVALAAHHPDGEPRGLQEAAHLDGGGGRGGLMRRAASGKGPEHLLSNPRAAGLREARLGITIGV